MSEMGFLGRIGIFFVEVDTELEPGTGGVNANVGA